MTLYSSPNLVDLHARFVCVFWHCSNPRMLCVVTLNRYPLVVTFSVQNGYDYWICLSEWSIYLRAKKTKRALFYFAPVSAKHNNLGIICSLKSSFHSFFNQFKCNTRWLHSLLSLFWTDMKKISSPEMEIFPLWALCKVRRWMGRTGLTVAWWQMSPPDPTGKTKVQHLGSYSKCLTLVCLEVDKPVTGIQVYRALVNSLPDETTWLISDKTHELPSCNHCWFSSHWRPWLRFRNIPSFIIYSQVPTYYQDL